MTDLNSIIEPSTAAYGSGTAMVILGLSLKDIGTITSIAASIIGLLVVLFTAWYNVYHKRRVREIMINDIKLKINKVPDE